MDHPGSVPETTEPPRARRAVPPSMSKVLRAIDPRPGRERHCHSFVAARSAIAAGADGEPARCGEATNSLRVGRKGGSRGRRISYWEQVPSQSKLGSIFQVRRCIIPAGKFVRPVSLHSRPTAFTFLPTDADRFTKHRTRSTDVRERIQDRGDRIRALRPDGLRPLAARGIEALVVDPGFGAGTNFELPLREGLEPAAILNTHGHVDHIAGNAAMKQARSQTPRWSSARTRPIS